MSWLRVGVTGGVVNRRNASALNPGELVSASGLRLKPGDLVQLHADMSTSTFGTPLNTVVAGPFWMPFENTADKILVVTTDGTDSYLETATAGSSGAFSSIQTISGAVTNAWVVHRGDQYFVGTDKGNYVVQDNVSRKMGMDGRSGSLFVAGTLGQTPFSSGTVAFDDNDIVSAWHTEYDSSTGIESGALALGTHAVDVLASPSDTMFYKFGTTRVNSNADKIRIYLHFHGNADNGSGSLDQTAFAFGSSEDYKSEKAPLIGGLLDEIDIGYVGASLGAGYYEFNPQSKLDKEPSYPLVSTDNIGTAIYEYLVKPRSFTIGALFNDSLVVNDPATSKQIIRYSPPGDPEYQPDPYFLYFATKRSDEVVGLRVVNNRLVVLLKDSVFRVNYLPTSGDLTAQQGRVQEPITERSGALGRWAHTTVETGQGSLVVWASKRGLEWTDGVGVQDACPDFKGITNANAVLVNNEKLYRLELYDGSERWDFYYHPTLMKDGHLRMMGPTTISAVVEKGADASSEYVWLGTSGSVLVGNTAEGSGSGKIVTGQIRAESPFADLMCGGVGATHTPLQSANARVYGKLEASDKADTGVVLFPDVGGDETSHVALSQRGKYLEVEAQFVGDGSWSVGPLYLNVDVEHGGND